MFTLKAFAVNDVYINNTQNTIATIGELSTQALTYSQNIGYYKSNSSSDINLVTFTSDVNNTPYILPQVVVDEIVSIIKFIYDASAASGNQIYADVLLNSLLNTFISIANDFSCGGIVNNVIPEWVSWTIINSTVDINNKVKIWFSNSSFEIQYDDYKITVIPPITPLDVFFESTTNIITALNSVTPTMLMSTIQNAKNGYPESIIAANDYNFVDPTTVGNLIPTSWYLLINGIAGTNLDVIRNSLIDYILSNSTHTQAQWTTIFPDIFKATEFIIIPNWNKYSIPNLTLQAGIYSPNIKISTALNLLTNLIPSYPAAHIASNADIFTQQYKSLTLLSIGSPDNNNNIYCLSDMFPDYINVSSTSLDFARMSQNTQNWAVILDLAIITAETMTNFSAIPNGMSKLTRNNILYLVFKFNNIDYLVASKASVKL